ncbi:MAG: phosphoglycerate kinase, partial [Gemmatimonadaceae bacterium]
MNKQTINDLTDAELRDKRALVRVDFNVPLDGERVADDTRIRAVLPTIQALLDRGARVILLSHLGRPKGKPDAQHSLEPVARRLGELLPKEKLCFVESTDTDEAIKASCDPSARVVLLENTRFLGGEEKNDERLSRGLAMLGDLYVNDAFGSAHRAHASTEGVAHFLKPAVAGLLMQKELDYLGSALENPKRPFVAILGGAKISGKIDVIEHLLAIVDQLVIGGAMACTFFRAMGLETGKSLVEDDRIAMAKELLARPGQKLVLPTDAMVARALDAGNAAHAVQRDAIPHDEGMFDIGPDSSIAFAKIIGGAKTVVWN